MKDWVEVVTNPLGLAGFALFVVFGLLARRGAAGGNRWLAPAAVAMAFVALVGGLVLAYRQLPVGQGAAPSEVQGAPATQKTPRDSVSTEPARSSSVVQETSGSQSPASPSSRPPAARAAQPSPTPRAMSRSRARGWIPRH